LARFRWQGGMALAGPGKRGRESRGRV
jgi:hypothetical protein